MGQTPLDWYARRQGITDGGVLAPNKQRHSPVLIIELAFYVPRWSNGYAGTIIRKESAYDQTIIGYIFHDIGKSHMLYNINIVRTRKSAGSIIAAKYEQHDQGRYQWSNVLSHDRI